jgi:hypothetical protein
MPRRGGLGGLYYTCYLALHYTSSNLGTTKTGAAARRARRWAHMGLGSHNGTQLLPDYKIIQASTTHRALAS